MQTGQHCQACHVGGYGPQLTPYGRAFKIGGYTDRVGSFSVPIAVQVVASYVHTRADQATPPTPDFGLNDNFALDQVGLFLAGGVGRHFGGFVQTTYDGVGKHWSWDNLDLRAVIATEVRGTSVTFGSSLNNSPGVQDPWNTLAAWGFPYTTSALAPSPGAAPLIAGGLAQTTLGLTGYAWIDSKFYVEAGGYRSPSDSLLTGLGADPFALGRIDNVAPYLRLAVQKPVGSGVFEVGAFGLRASIFPGGDRTSGTTDRYTDVGIDASYQRVRANGDVVSLNTRFTHEIQTLRASVVLGGATTVDATLDDFRLDTSYYWHNAIGGTVGMFATTGSADPLRFGGRTGRPDSNGYILQVDGTPFGNGSFAGSWVNVRVGVQYIGYTSFDGAHTNYDGAGTNASANNSVRLFTWFAF